MGDLFYKYLIIPLYLLPDLNLDRAENIQLIITFFTMFGDKTKIEGLFNVPLSKLYILHPN